MTATLPPWLNINPTENLIQSAQLGAGMGEKYRAQSDEETKMRNDLGVEMARIGAEREATQARVGEAAQAHQMATANLQLESQKAQIGEQEAKMKMNMAAEVAGRKYQAQQAYQQAYQQNIAQGMSPDDAGRAAALSVGPWAVSGTGEAGLWSRPKTATSTNAQVPEGYSEWNGKLYPSKATLPGGMSQKTAEDIIDKYDADQTKYGRLFKTTDARTKLYNKAMAVLMRDDEGDDVTGGAPAPMPGNLSPNPQFQSAPGGQGNLSSAQFGGGGAGGGANPQDPLGLGIGGKGTSAAPPGSAPAPGTAPDAQNPADLQTGIPSIDKAVQGQLQAAAEQKQQMAEAAKQQKIKAVTQQIDSIQKEIEAIVGRQKIEDMSQTERDDYYEKAAESGSLSSAQLTGGTPIDRAQRVKAAQTKLAQLNQMLSQLTSQ